MASNTAADESMTETDDQKGTKWDVVADNLGVLGEDDQKENPAEKEDDEDKEFEAIMSVLESMKTSKKKKKDRRKGKENQNYMMIDYSNAKVVQTGSGHFPNDLQMQGRTHASERKKSEKPSAEDVDKAELSDSEVAEESWRGRSGRSRGGSGKSRESSGDDESRSRRRRRRRREGGVSGSRSGSYGSAQGRRGCRCKHDFLPLMVRHDKETMTEVGGNTVAKGWVGPEEWAEIRAIFVPNGTNMGIF